MLSIRAGYFDVHCDLAPNVVAAKCKAYAGNPPAQGTEIAVNGQTFQLTDPQWRDDDGIFTATMWRVRKTNLPSVRKEGGMEEVGGELAESASTAFAPQHKLSLVQYNHSGPRHNLFATFLEAIGIKGPVSLTAVVHENALERMQHSAIVRRIEYTLGDIQDEAPLRGAGLGGIIDALRAVKGTTIKVEISLGHTKGSLGEQAKHIAQSLSEMATGVRTVKAGVQEKEDKATEMLDLLGGRLFIDLNIPESGRELDRAVCRDRLRQALKDRQITSEEGDDDGE